MNQFNQMGMQSMGQRSTPPLPMGATGNQVRTELNIYTFFNLKKIKLSTIFWLNATQPIHSLLRPLCFVPLDGNGWTQDGAAQCQSTSESVSVPGTVSWFRSRSWTSSAWYGPTWWADRSGSGKLPLRFSFCCSYNNGSYVVSMWLT